MGLFLEPFLMFRTFFMGLFCMGLFCICTGSVVPLLKYFPSILGLTVSPALIPQSPSLTNFLKIELGQQSGSAHISDWVESSFICLPYFSMNSASTNMLLQFFALELPCFCCMRMSCLVLTHFDNV